ncbi:MAG TPA: YceI family protein [Acidimicrobiales bacterium]|nr:YceI family protein [Acidimicrobiales bacterium]
MTMTTTTSQGAGSTRQYKGVAVPAPGVYDLDQAHTTVEFVARHLMITKVRGRFADFSGSVHIAEVPEESSVDVTINGASVNTSQEQRDAHLRSADFLDVENHPTLTFKSTGVELGSDGDWEVTGDLTILGTARPVVLNVEFDGANTTPWGTQAVAFSAWTEIDREDWGLTYNQALEAGGVVVSKKVRIELNVEAVLRQEQAEGAA